MYILQKLHSKQAKHSESSAEQEKVSSVRIEEPELPVKSIEATPSYTSSFNSASSAPSKTLSMDASKYPLGPDDWIIDRSSISSTSSMITFDETVPTLSKAVSSNVSISNKLESEISSSSNVKVKSVISENIQEHTTTSSSKKSAVIAEESLKSSDTKHSTATSVSELKSLDTPQPPVVHSSQEIDTVIYEDDSMTSDSCVSNLNVSFSTVGMVSKRGKFLSKKIIFSFFFVLSLGAFTHKFRIICTKFMYFFLKN